MQIRKISTIFQYVSWLLKNYNEQRNNHQNDIYRIAEIKQLSSGENKIIIQVIGKSTFIECTPQETVMDDRLLEGFSKSDVRTITYFACKQSQKPKYRIVIQEFCDKLNRVLFKLKIKDSDKAVLKSANEILTDKDILDNLSKDDIKSISYIAGCEHLQNERNEMHSAKNGLG